MKPRLQITFIFILLVGPGLILISNSSHRSIAQNRELTFSRDVAPIVYEHCAACHRPDDIAPFSILDYEDALPFKDAIKQKVAAREMPPWHAARAAEKSN
jgi:hypothetical protein